MKHLLQSTATLNPDTFTCGFSPVILGTGKNRDTVKAFSEMILYIKFNNLVLYSNGSAEKEKRACS